MWSGSPGIRASWVIGAVVSLLLAACGGATGETTITQAEATEATAAPTTAAAEPAEETTTAVEAAAVTLQTNFRVFGNHTPFFAGIAEGFFAQEGIELSVEPGTGSADAAVNAATGTIQFGLADSVAATKASAEGADIYHIAAYMAANPGGMCYVADRHQIDDVADFAGLTVGGAEGDAYIIALQGLMAEAGADPESIDFVATQPGAGDPALLAGQLDAVPCGSGTRASLVQAGAEEGLEVSFFGYADKLEVIGFSIVTGKSLVESDPALVQRFVNAYATSVIWSVDNPEDAIDHFIADNRELERELELSKWRDVTEVLEGRSGYFVFDEEQVALTIEFVNSAYGLDLNPSGEGLFTNQFAKGLPAELIQGKRP